MDDKLLEDLSKEIESVREILSNISKVKGKVTKFLYFHLNDAFRMAHLIHILHKESIIKEIYSTEGIELMVRNMMEKMIVCSYIETHKSPDIINRYLKTSEMNFVKSWELEFNTEAKDLTNVCLPDYKEMAKNIHADTYKSYKKISYNCHPRTTQPYTLVEYENIVSKTVKNSKEFYLFRSRDSLKSTTMGLKLIKNIFGRSYNKSLTNNEIN